MARLHPERIPEWYRNDPARRAECDVIEALGASLGRDWDVFGWAGWTTPDGAHDVREGEVDAIVAHPELGLATLEINGGGIFYDAGIDAWSSEDSGGRIHAIQDPYGQAARSRDTLLRKLRAHPRWHGRAVPHGYGVVLPDAAASMDVPRDQRLYTLFYEDLPHLDERVPRMLGAWRHHGTSPLGDDGMQLLREVVARSLRCRIPFAAAVRDERERMEDLTEQQFNLLGLLAGRRRVLIEGPAGSGKTFLALKKARRLADEGVRTLLTCFNRPLADRLAAETVDRPNLTVMSFNQLCWNWAARVGRSLPDPDGEAARNLPRDYFDRDLPRQLTEAAAQLGESFEAIVVDEGQDFGEMQRDALLCTAADPRDGVLYVFQDPTQRIYPDRAPWPGDGMESYPLDQNLRNTRRIHGALSRLGKQSGRAGRSEGREPEFLAVHDDRERSATLSRLLHRLVEDDKFQIEQIVVLVTSRSDIPRLAPDGRIGKFAITAEHEPRPQRLLVESIPRFKGLERDVVVLTCVRPTDYMDYDATLYVGASRPRFHLAVVDNPEVIERFREGGSGLE